MFQVKLMKEEPSGLGHAHLGYTDTFDQIEIQTPIASLCFTSRL